MLFTDKIDKKTASSRVAFGGLMLTLALILSYVESLIPLGAIVPIPGFKLGLANVVVMIIFVYSSPADACVVSFLRVLISSVLFGSVPALWFSFLGAAMSLAALAVMRAVKFRGMSWVGVSVVCAVSHNAGQLIAAATVLGGGLSVAWYFPWLLVMAVICGTVTGGVVCVTDKKLQRRTLHNGT